MTKWAMAIDLDKCIGCQTCSMACRIENNVPFAEEEETNKNRAIFWQEVIYQIEGEFPDVKARYLPRPCMHCEDSPCQKVCPVGATYKNEDDLILINYDICIGCRYCTVACPYTVRYFNWFEPKYPENATFNPDVPLRTKGVVEKCTYCSHRIEKAKTRHKKEEYSQLLNYMESEDKKCSTICHQPPAELEESEGEITYAVVPACVQACPAGARYFGDIEDKNSTIYKLSKSPRVFKLQEHLGTEPKTFYLSEEKWNEV